MRVVAGVLKFAGPVTLLAMSACLVAAALGLFASPRTGEAAPQAPAKTIDPAAWGADHVEQPLPEFMESGECLFCHRHDVGLNWGPNQHNRTVREPEADEPAIAALAANEATKAFADQVQLIMGDKRAQRYLKRSAAYGKADLLSVTATFGRGRRARLDGVENVRWDEQTFATQCAGCHTTAVDPELHAFAGVSIDCYSCHGDAEAEHANDTKLMPLAKARKDSPEVVTSICASCHIRFGKSKASGLPYPTNFVAGDNLFKDFEVDFTKAEDESLNPADRHVMQNVRDVVLAGHKEVTCLSCHDVHNNTSKKHREVADNASCNLCHEAQRPITGHKTYEVHSERCQY